ncbi:MAG: A/G-specific adenine glycosylase [Lachnospiraceae bacterium]|nr:A/G-specific adenine glycosylase [Lachnospiraceae bacterium]MCM1238190.1 A/G-specific adenine glycosylase [Lachnospiraceae bacterium]
MRYNHIIQGRFIERPNRFIAKVEIDGRVETVHVKNTGRCRELLTQGARVCLEKSDKPGRSTAYDLVAVEKGARLINMDSQAPNRAAEEWLLEKGLFPDSVLVRPETTYGNSRFDFYVETGSEKIFIEVKGVTLEEDGVARFPDAPSDRAVKHVEELIRAKKAGYRVFVLFVIQMEGVRYFTPNHATHREFGEALCRASEAGVEILARDCIVTPDSMRINVPVPVRFAEDHELLSRIPKPLLRWYDKNRRILPWREEPSPYRVWISEVMLQQTRVEAVKPYFERFLREFPDIASLAGAEEESLLKLWEGLGYYNRARNLREAARQIQETYGGEMPAEYEELLKLKGIGSYTAGAVASIAYGRAVPAVDGNVLRVLSRIRKDLRPVSDAKVKAAVERDLREILPADRPGDFNQAMMEIGACVCIPNGAPLCENCPLKDICMAHQAGEEQSYPGKAAKKPRVVEEKTILIIRDENHAAIRRRAERGLLAGMYEFPSMDGFRTAEEVTAYLAENGLEPLYVRPLREAKHIFTHREWHMWGYLVRVDGLEPKEEQAAGWICVEPEETKEKYPIPSAFGAYMEYLRMRPGAE